MANQQQPRNDKWYTPQLEFGGNPPLVLHSSGLRETAWKLARMDHETRERGETRPTRAWLRKVPRGINGRTQEQYFAEIQRLTD